MKIKVPSTIRDGMADAPDLGNTPTRGRLQFMPRHGPSERDPRIITRQLIGKQHEEASKSELIAGLSPLQKESCRQLLGFNKPI